MSSNHRLVVEFNQKVLGIQRPPRGIPDKETYELSLTQLREEVEELEEAILEGDLAKAVDALVDIDYFLHGIIYKFGINENHYNLFFQLVHRANMRKQLGKAKGREEFSAADASKPEGWEDPVETIRHMLDDLAAKEKSNGKA